MSREEWIKEIDRLSKFRKLAVYLDFWINHNVYENRFHNGFTKREINMSFEEFCKVEIYDWYDKFLNCGKSKLQEIE